MERGFVYCMLMLVQLGTFQTINQQTLIVMLAILLMVTEMMVRPVRLLLIHVILDTKMMVREYAFLLLVIVLMVTKMMELEIVFLNPQVHVHPTLLMMEMEDVFWLSRYTFLALFSLILKINPVDVILHARNVSLEVTVNNVMSVMLLILLQSHVFIVVDVNLAVLRILLNVQLVSPLKCSTALPRHAMTWPVQQPTASNVIWMVPAKFVLVDIG